MNISKWMLPAAVILTMAGLAQGGPAPVISGETLVKEMHGRYAASWYPAVTFTQKSTTYNPEGTTKVETWYEAALLPGKLRIDIGPPKDGNGYLLVDGNVTVFKEGQATTTGWTNGTIFQTQIGLKCNSNSSCDTTGTPSTTDPTGTLIFN